MANPLFEALNGNRMAGMLEQFQQFRKEMEGRNPNEEINRLLQSGKINQQQLNQAQQMAQQMQGMFKGFLNSTQPGAHGFVNTLSKEIITMTDGLTASDVAVLTGGTGKMTASAEIGVHGLSFS